MTHRIVNQITQYPESQGDQNLLQQLMLYKTPAIIRDTKVVYFYVNVFANTITINPLRVYHPNRIFEQPLGTPVTLNDCPNYYAPLGTTRKFNIGEQVNSLMDLVIPQDKYYLEINLVEAQIEADPSNYIKIPNDFITPIDTNADRWVVSETFDLDYVRQADPVLYPVPPAGIPRTGFVGPIARRATKRSIPQPLFVRLKGLDNNEPYNWSVSNNGNVNLDKSHQVVIRHGSVNYQQLELEFGHLVFTGKDSGYQAAGRNLYTNQPAPRGQQMWEENYSNGGAMVDAIPNSDAQRDIKFYNNYQYLDYNYEWENNYSRSINTNMENPRFNIPACRGLGFRTEENLIEAFRPIQEIVLASTPLKTNQQVSNMIFRLSIRLIHLF